jgi:hypothetical protein
MDGAPALAVIGGHTYMTQAQVFSRWCLPTYQTSFRWTGNRADAEDATTWVFMHALGHLRLPEPVSLVDECIAEATLEAAGRHWCDRYGVARPRCCEIYDSESVRADRHAFTLEALVDSLSAEMRLVIVLRFLRKRPLSAIAAQLGIVPPAKAPAHLYTALSGVAERIGIDTRPHEQVQVDHVAAYVNDLVGKRRPLRFEALPGAWAALVAATHLQAAIVGNDIPAARFVRSLEEDFEASRTARSRRHVTHLRIWSA